MNKVVSDSIRAGMKDACDEAFEFSGEQGRVLDCEYLLTVKVAQSIRKGLGVTQGSPYRIFLEHRTTRFASGCVPLFGKAPDGRPYRSTLRRLKNTTRNGKIDIAVYDDATIAAPVCAVEIKGFNPSRTSVLADLRRNLEYLRFQDITGKSRLRHTFFAAMHSFPKTTCDADCDLDIARLEDRYRRWLRGLGAMRDVESRVSSFTVDKAFDTIPYEGGEYVELQAHHFAGVIVAMEPAS